MYRTFRENINTMDINNKDTGNNISMFQEHSFQKDLANPEMRKLQSTDNLGISIIPMKIILLFPDTSFQIKNIGSICDPLNIIYDTIWSIEGALLALQNNVYDIMIVDRRKYDNEKIDFNQFVSTIRNKITSPTFRIISFNDKVVEDYSQLWGLGYHEHWVNYDDTFALKNYLDSYRRNQFSISIQQNNMIIFKNVFDKYNDSVEILDSDFNIETVNHTFQKKFKQNVTDVTGMDWFKFHKIPTDKKLSIINEVQMRKKWKGILSKPSEAPYDNCVHLNVRIKTLDSDYCQYVVYIKTISTNHLKREHSASLGSYDGDVTTVSSNRNSDPFLSRTQLSIESPILKIMKIINSIQDSATPTLNTQLQNIVEILSSKDLFITTVDALKTDIMSSNLIDGLLSNNATIFAQTENRRHSSLSVKRRQTRDNSEIIHDHINQVLAKISKIPEISECEEARPIDELLEEHQNWSFDIFRLESLSEFKPLRNIGMKIFSHFDLGITLNIDKKLFENWLYVIESNYKDSNTYHNSTHAADVLQSSAWFLERGKINDIFDSFDDAISIIAAIIHDLGHPGRTNPFLINSNNNLAVFYNDIAVLENHHVSFAFKLTLKDERINIFKNLSSDDYRVLRHGIIDAVLATEMAKHFEHLTKFLNNIMKVNDATGNPQLSMLSECGKYSNIQETEILCHPDNKAIIRRMLIKCSDVNNPTRPFPLSKKWASRISEEYFNQTDDEIAMNIPVVMPQFNRKTSNIPQSQITFIELFLEDMFIAWNIFADTEELITNLMENKATWKAISDKENNSLRTMSEES